MKKLLSMFLATAMSVSLLAGCSSGSKPAETVEKDGETEVAVEESTDASGYELALITDVGTIDDRSFNQGSWEGMVMYANDFNVTHKYYKPAEKTTDAYLSSIDLAIKNGAKVIVCPGFLFEGSVFIAQNKYPDTKFVLLDAEPKDENGNIEIADNTYSIFYAEEQAGFLAGYAAVKEGYRKLGFLGGLAVPPVIRFGYGFIQGAELAGRELKLADGEIDIKYTYVGNFNATPENQTVASSWYQSGTEVIFACGGGVGNSVMAAAEMADAKVIGVDIDQSFDSETVITSAIKELGNSTYDAIKRYYDDEFPGGKSTRIDAKVNGIGLVMENSRFEKFTNEDYDIIFNVLAEDKEGIASSILDDTEVDSADGIKTKVAKVEVVE